MSKRTRLSIAEVERHQSLVDELAKTETRLLGLQREESEHRQALELCRSAQHQMVGRMRFIQEQLGLVEPMVEAKVLELPLGESEEDQTKERA